jgi:hypothetical protein
MWAKVIKQRHAARKQVGDNDSLSFGDGRDEVINSIFFSKEQ